MVLTESFSLEKGEGHGLVPPCVVTLLYLQAKGAFRYTHEWGIGSAPRRCFFTPHSRRWPEVEAVWRLTVKYIFLLNVHFAWLNILKVLKELQIIQVSLPEPAETHFQCQTAFKVHLTYLRGPSSWTLLLLYEWDLRTGPIYGAWK